MSNKSKKQPIQINLLPQDNKIIFTLIISFVIISTITIGYSLYIISPDQTIYKNVTLKYANNNTGYIIDMCNNEYEFNTKTQIPNISDSYNISITHYRAGWTQISNMERIYNYTEKC